MEFGRAFTFATEDPDWLKKVGIAALVMLIPFVGWLTVFGWGLEITRRVLSGESETLPEWSNFSAYLVLGLKWFVVWFAFTLPANLINGCQSGFNTLLTSPELLQSMDSDVLGAVVAASSGIAICCGCLGAILGLAAAFIMPAAYGNMMANNGDLGAAFRFSEVFGLLRAAIGPYLMVFLGSLAVGLIVPFGLIACGVGVFFTLAWGTTVNSHLFGQAYKAAKAAVPASM